MKYKVKFTGYSPNGLFLDYKEGHVIESSMQPNKNGISVFIPFTDQRFFEPIKTRAFQVEVSEENMNEFSYCLGIRGYHSEEGNDPRWTVTEITDPTLPYWVIEFKSQNPEATIDSFKGIDPVWIVENFKGQKLHAIKWVKDHTGAWLKDCKDLVDYIFNTFD